MVSSQSVFRIPSFLIPSILILSLVLSGVLPMMAQSVAAARPSKKFAPETDLSLGTFGQLTPTRAPLTNDFFSGGTSVAQMTQGASVSAGVLGSIHHAVTPWLGYDMNLGYSRFAERYSSGFASAPAGVTTPPRNPTSNFSQGSIRTNMYELTGAYSIEGPKTGRWSTSAQLGGGGLFFLPTHDPSPYAEQFRLAMVFGAGISYRLSEHFGLRAEYRGLFYKNPDFKNSETLVPISKLFTVTSEPTISIVYTFGHKRTKSLRGIF